MTVMMDDHKRNTCTFELTKSGKVLVKCPNDIRSGPITDDIRFADGIYRYDPITKTLVLKSGGTATQPIAPAPGPDDVIVSRAALVRLRDQIEVMSRG